MIMKKNPACPPDYWAQLLAELEDELNIGWGSVSVPMDERQVLLKKIVTMVHDSLKEANDVK